MRQSARVRTALYSTLAVIFLLAVLLARHDAAAFRQKYAAIRELAEVMQAIDGFLATPEDAVAAKG